MIPKILKEWMALISDPEDKICTEIVNDPETYIDLFSEGIAHSLYEDMRRSRMLVTSPFTISQKYEDLQESDKTTWLDFAAGIPLKLSTLGLKIRPFTEYYRTCIITDEEIEKLACIDHARYFKDPVTKFQGLQDARKWYFMELNYFIPLQLKKIGFEIVRTGEEMIINQSLLRKLAKAIHSRYLQEMRDLGSEGPAPVYPGDQESYLMEFDDLPEEIKFSNIDNAYHIATKLLSIGYRIKPVKQGFEPATLKLNELEIETLAKIEHIRWSWDKRLNGWIFGNIKDNTNKTHPGLVPYEKLVEAEKEKDRDLVRLIPALLNDIGYVAYPVSSDNFMNLSYAIKPRSSIHYLLTETQKLNEEIKELTSSNPAVNEKISLTNRKIEETIDEVRGSYNYAQHIQKTYLPEDLYIRECFPDHFVLFKPKDLISGDFYFFSKKGNIRIFAAADCTGHGIPGALLSTIGYLLTDQAVNGIGMTAPAEILCHIYSRMHKFLRKEDEQSGIYDDMDIALCTYDVNTRIINYAGVTIPLYRISNGELIEYRATNSIEQCYDGYSFNYEKIQALKGDLIYLCSDGFSDQFGGKFHKKYQRTRFRSFIQTIHRLPLQEQRDLLFEELENWRDQNNEDQTDDILVLAIRI